MTEDSRILLPGAVAMGEQFPTFIFRFELLHLDCLILPLKLLLQ
jgi:hypothetical protein